MKPLYFLAQLPADFNPAAGDTVSLTPQVSYALEKKGISFRILRRNEEDLMTRGDDDAFFLSQVEWINRVDVFLQHALPILKENKIRPAYHHFSKIKFVLDTLIIYALEILHFLQQHPTEHIIYYGKKEPPVTFSIFELRSNGELAYRTILQKICLEKGIRLEICEIDEPSQVTPQTGVSFKQRVKRFSKECGFKRWFHFFKYHKWELPRLNILKRQRPGILFLDAGSEKIDHVIKEFIRRGYQIYTLIGKDIFEYSDFRETKVSSLAETPLDRDYLKSLLRVAAENLIAEDWLLEPSQIKTSFDLAPVFTPYLKHFVSEIIPDVVADYLSFKDFCENFNIQLMVAQGSSGKQYPAALNIAKNSENVKSVCFQHSCGPTYWLDWVFGELDYFNYFMTTDDLHQDFFGKMARESWLSRCEVRQSPFYLKKLSQRYPVKMQNSIKTVLYIPRKQSMRISKFNSYLYPLPWLYEIQKAIVDTFSRHPEIHVIYKHHPSSKWAHDSILPYIKEKGYNNISVQEGRLDSFFSKVDRVFMDYPSTPLFESAAAGLPCLALYPSADRIIPAMEVFFGPSLRPFSTAQEAGEILENFLSQDAKIFIKSLTYSQENALNFLEEALVTV